jgi:hypothetical protein
MDVPEYFSSQRKALKLNRDASRYGTFAEIGAGQEVARWFFRVGGAAGTVAKTMSAYDMVFSDAIYGPTPKYVSRLRLITMLEHEYQLLIERLSSQRGENTIFFAYANTVKAKGYLDNSYCHGWMGIRFQTRPLGPPNDLIMHVWMHDRTNLLQQEAIGIMGVNLINGALYEIADLNLFLSSLFDGLNRERIEIDMIEASGPDVTHIDNQLMNLKLVSLNYTSSVVFAANRSIHQASEILYKRPCLISRGRFRPVTLKNYEMIQRAISQFRDDLGIEHSQPVDMMELCLQNARSEEEYPIEDYLARIDTLNFLGKTVLVSNTPEFYRLANHLRRNTREPIGIVLSVVLFKELFEEKYYEGLEGGLLESFGRLFKRDLKLYVYPVKLTESGAIQNLDNIDLRSDLKDILTYLKQNRSIIELDTPEPRELYVDVNKLLKEGNSDWKKYVQPQLARYIEQKNYFI